MHSTVHSMFFTLFLFLLSSSMPQGALCGTAPAESFVAPREPRTDRSRCTRLREHLMEQLSEYVDAIIDELSFWAQLLEKEKLPEAPLARVVRRLTQLSTAESFVMTGTTDHAAPPAGASIQTMQSAVIALINQIARVQRALMGALRGLLMGDAECCFVRARTKNALERHIAAVQHLIQDSRDIITIMPHSVPETTQ